MSRIDRIRRSALVRRAYRAEAEAAPAERGLPAPIEPVEPPRSFREARPRGDAEFAAHVLGQGGERRGLRAGPPALQAARAAYNRIEWSGRYDRRARKGRQAREDV
jgi:hypothetical protein